MLSSKYINIIIIVTATLLFIPFLGNVHLFDWDEINFAESAREMIVTGDYLNVRINFELFWEKPPLFIWMQVLSMKIFGINEFAARFPNSIAGIVTLLFLFNIGKKHFGTKLGLMWVFAYAGSVLPHFYFKSGIIDPWFNLFIFLGIYFFFRYLIENKRQTKYVLLSAVFIGLGTLTKGPVALLIFLLTGFIYLIINRFKMRISIPDIILYIVTFVFVGGFWFILQILNGNYDILYDFVIYQIRLFQTEDAGHGGFLGYHFVILLIGVFPASIFALKAFKKDKNEKHEQKKFKQWMLILFWVVLILFSIVKTKIIHYSSLAYFPLTFLGAYALCKTESGVYKKSKVITGIFFFFAVFYASVIFILQYVGQNSKKIIESGIIKDEFAAANLQAQTSFTGFEFLLGIFLILGIISAFIFIKRSYYIRNAVIFIVIMVFTNLTVLVIVPEVEKISQGATVEFYKSKKNEDAYFDTYGMKSYAQFFYGEIKISAVENFKKGKQKKIYVTCRNYKTKELEKRNSEYKKLYEKNGFVFWQRIE